MNSFKKGRPPLGGLIIFNVGFSNLDWGDFSSLNSLGTFFDDKFNILTLIKPTVAIHLDRAEVHKYILAILSTYKTITLAGIEPLDGSDNTFCHFLLHLTIVFDLPNCSVFGRNERNLIASRLKCQGDKINNHLTILFPPITDLNLD
jgi:hypothetical protein